MLAFARVGWPLTALLALALAVRVAAAVVWQGRLPDEQPFAFPDSESYWALGGALAQGGAYEFAGWRAFRTPAYPAVLAPLFWVYGDRPPVIAARLLGALLGTAAAAGVSCLAWKLFDKNAALAAAALAALYPGALAMSVLVLSEALFCPLMVASLLLWAASWQAPARKRRLTLAAAAGAAGGLAILARPSWILFVPLAVLLSIALYKPRSRGLEIGGVMLAAVLVAMAPWWVRNWMSLKAFVPTTTQVGASLYDGLHPAATGGSDMSFVPRVEAEFRRRGWNGEPRWRYEVELNRHFAREALHFACENPGRAAELAAVKLLRTWNIWPNEPSLRTWPVRLAVAAGYVPILVLGVLGAAWFSRRGWPYVLCWLPAVYFSLLHMVFVGSIRYRQPALLILIVLAAGAISAWLKRGQGSGLRGARLSSDGG